MAKTRKEIFKETNLKGAPPGFLSPDNYTDYSAP
jgi:hypothetical protein